MRVRVRGTVMVRVRVRVNARVRVRVRVRLRVRVRSGLGVMEIGLGLLGYFLGRNIAGTFQLNPYYIPKNAWTPYSHFQRFLFVCFLFLVSFSCFVFLSGFFRNLSQSFQVFFPGICFVF